MDKATQLRDLLRVASIGSLSGENFDKFYVETSDARGKQTASILADYFLNTKDEPQKVLFMGHGGSGKSTEIWKIMERLKEDYWIVLLDIRKETDFADVNYIDIIFAMLNKIMEKAQKDGLNIDETLLDRLYDYWHDEKLLEIFNYEKAEVQTGAEAKIGFLNYISAMVKGVLTTGKESKASVRKIIEPKLGRLIESINDFLVVVKQQLHSQGKVPIIIVENLDKIDILMAEDIFLNHRSVIAELNVHILFTFPIFLRYSENFSEIKGTFPRSEILSMIKVNNKDTSPYEKGREILKDIIGKRADSSLFDEGVIEFIIERSGGYLRDIFEMVQNAALIARSDDISAKSIDMGSATKAYIELRSDFERTIGRRHIETLKAIYNDPEKQPMQDDNLMELLKFTAVIEYNGKRWCDLHPAVAEILRNKKLIK